MIKAPDLENIKCDCMRKECSYCGQNLNEEIRERDKICVWMTSVDTPCRAYDNDCNKCPYYE